MKHVVETFTNRSVTERSAECGECLGLGWTRDLYRKFVCPRCLGTGKNRSRP